MNCINPCVAFYLHSTVSWVCAVTKKGGELNTEGYK